jgi:hypothetical protein
MSPPFAQYGPSNDPRIIHLKCRECERQWVELVPEKNARAFCWGLACQCGENADGDGLILVSGHDLLKDVARGA